MQAFLKKPVLVFPDVPDLRLPEQQGQIAAEIVRLRGRMEKEIARESEESFNIKKNMLFVSAAL